jgi:hypothetical protein
MKTVKLLPLLLLAACSTTRYQDNSKHYSYTNIQSNYQRNHQENRQSEHHDSARYQPTEQEYPSDQTVYEQVDSQFLASANKPRPKLYATQQRNYDDNRNCDSFNNTRSPLRFPRHHHPVFPYPFFAQ